MNNIHLVLTRLRRLAKYAMLACLVVIVVGIFIGDDPTRPREFGHQLNGVLVVVGAIFLFKSFVAWAVLAFLSALTKPLATSGAE